jgi:quinol monooxygenase YgiN
MYLIIWEFRAAAGREGEFQQAYGPEGDWARFFRRDPGYRGTELFRDTADPGRFLTLDRWTDAAVFDAFEARHRVEYRALDRQLAPLCASERRVTGVTLEG